MNGLPMRVPGTIASTDRTPTVGNSENDEAMMLVSKTFCESVPYFVVFVMPRVPNMVKEHTDVCPALPRPSLAETR